MTPGRLRHRSSAALLRRSALDQGADDREAVAPMPGSAGRRCRGFGMLAPMGPTRTEILSALALVGVLVFLMLVLVVWAIPPGGPPALQ